MYQTISCGQDVNGSPFEFLSGPEAEKEMDSSFGSAVLIGAFIAGRLHQDEEFIDCKSEEPHTKLREAAEANGRRISGAYVLTIRSPRKERGVEIAKIVNQRFRFVACVGVQRFDKPTSYEVRRDATIEVT